MNPDDPNDSEFQYVLDLERKRIGERRISVSGFMLIFLTVVTLISALLHEIPVIEPVKNIILPVFALLFPLVIARSYPKNAPQDDTLLKRPVMQLRLNLVGAFILAAGLNLIFAFRPQWELAKICLFISLYGIALCISLRPVFGNKILPPSRWPLQDSILRIVTLLFTMFTAQRLWSILIDEHQLMNLTGDMEFLVPLLAITILVPFYIGYFISNLPDVNPRKTKGVNEEQLRELFPNENMPRML
jgi:hypothetical protein